MKRLATLVILVLSRGFAFGQNASHTPDDHFRCPKAKDATVPPLPGRRDADIAVALLVAFA